MTDVVVVVVVAVAERRLVVVIDDVGVVDVTPLVEVASLSDTLCVPASSDDSADGFDDGSPPQADSNTMASIVKYNNVRLRTSTPH